MSRSLPENDMTPIREYEKCFLMSVGTYHNYGQGGSMRVETGRVYKCKKCGQTFESYEWANRCYDEDVWNEQEY